MRKTHVLILLAAVGCSKVTVSAEGKECPCPDGRGLTCDPVCLVCVPLGAAPGASCGGSGADACTPKITVTDFHAEWVTPNSIFWVWKPDDPGKVDDFQSYRLALTAASPPGPTKLYDVSTNPELGLYLLPNGGADLTRSTLITDLEPGVEYTARLVVRDRDGCEFSTKNTAPATHVPSSQTPVRIFGEGGFSGSTLGGSVTHANCYQGSSCFQMATCQLAAETSKCCDNLRVLDIDIPLTFSAGQFTQAYLEFYARNDAAFATYYSNVWLRVGDASSPYTYSFPAWTFPATGHYRRLQFPLRMLELGDGTKLTYATLTSGNVVEFNWYTCVGLGASAWFDEVYVKW